MPVNWLSVLVLVSDIFRFAENMCPAPLELLVNAGYAVQPSQTTVPAKSSPRTSAGTSLPRLSLTAYSVCSSVVNVHIHACSPSRLIPVSSM